MSLSRRKFLEYGAVIGSSVLVTGCKGSSASGASNPNKPIVLGSLLDSTGAIKVLENGLGHAGGQNGTVSFDKTHHINHAIYILKSNANQGFDLVAGPFPNISAADDQGRCDLIAHPNTFTQFTPKT